MTPAGIVLEKFLARLLPMAWLLMLTGPLLGITYSMGGFSRGAISVALLVLLLARCKSAVCRCFGRVCWGVRRVRFG